jgi:alpha-tubulin suppressor-like RCC1 family protein
VAGIDFTCALVGSGAVYCWGANAFGQLGDGTTIQRTSAVAVSGLTDAVEIEAGYQHACARTTAGEMRCWGRNHYGQVNRDATTVPQLTTPGPVTNDGLAAGPALTGVAQIALGAYYSCARLTTGGVRCWGVNTSCELGRGGATAMHFTPQVVAGVTDAVEIHSGVSHTMVRTSSGAVFGWGYSNQGQIGAAAVNYCTALNMSISALAVRGGYTASCVRVADGTVSCRGDNNERQLGRNSTVGQAATWGTVVGVAGVTELFTGFWTYCAHESDGELKCWGRNDYGQIGDGATSVMARDPAVLNTLVPPGVRGMALGAYHSCAMLAVGRVSCWGQNSFGQLGNGSTTDSFTALTIVSGLP